MVLLLLLSEEQKQIRNGFNYAVIRSVYFKVHIDWLAAVRHR
jgi:hypothetical protein